MSAQTETSRIYIHRRVVVRFLVVMLVVLSALSFASIAFGWGEDSQLALEDSSTPTALSDTSPFYVLLIGTDSLEGTALYSGAIDNQERQPYEQQADALTLMRVDPSSFTITLVTVPSNTCLYDSDEQVRDSLFEGGPMAAEYTVERITGVDVRYYFMLDFSDFEAVLDSVGKISADVPFTIRTQDPVTAKTVTVRQGVDRKLNSAQALAFLRAWEQYDADADAYRQLNVRTVEREVIGQVLDLDDEEVRLVLGTFERNCVTDMDNSLLISLVTHFYQNREALTIYSCTGPYLATNIGPTGEPIIRQQVSAWRELMTVVDNGEDPAAVFPEYDFKPIDPADYVVEEDERASSSSSSSGRAGKSSSSSRGSSASSSGKSETPAKAGEEAESEPQAPEGGGDQGEGAAPADGQDAQAELAIADEAPQPVDAPPEEAPPADGEA